MKTENKKQTVIDMTPTWFAVAKISVALIERGNTEGRKNAMENFNQMAEICERVRNAKPTDTIADLFKKK